MHTVPPTNFREVMLPPAGSASACILFRRWLSALQRTCALQSVADQSRDLGRVVLIRLAVLLLLLGAGIANAQVKVESVFRFVDKGSNPQSGLVRGRDGRFYGTTYSGGTNDKGTVFRISTAGEYEVLHFFVGIDGQNPSGELIQGRDGRFYGTTCFGGANAKAGTVFRISESGEYAVLHSFNDADGKNPPAAVVQGSDGYFYGVTSYGGANGVGTVFRISETGEYKVIHSFASAGGGSPRAGLIKGSDGFFYGTTSHGGVNTLYGTIFRISPEGEYSVLHSFDNRETSEAELLQGSDGNFYGTTTFGIGAIGTIFRISAAGAYAVLHSFNGSDGRNPLAGLVQGRDGYFYGTTSTGGANGYGTVFRISAAGEYTLLHSFDRVANLKNPYCSGLVQGNDGSFYGTTNGGKSGKGTIFRISEAGEYTELYILGPTNGRSPNASLTQGRDGNFYGTTFSGGKNDCGTIFRITETRYYTVLYSFTGPDGSAPRAGLVQGSDGHFYGTTSSGGTSGYGTVFRISAAGEYTVLHSFAGSDGSAPRAGLVQGSDGHFYGTTSSGGTNGYGVVFQISTTGEYTVLHSLNFNDGSSPDAELLQGSDGHFYGTASSGGTSGKGVIFRISATGEYTVLHHFAGADGSSPDAGLVQSSDGYFYGTTSSGGANGKGTIFRISAAGEHVVLHSFTGLDGTTPRAGLVQGDDGYFYGAVPRELSNYGIIFRISAAGEYSVLDTLSSIDGTSSYSALVKGADGNLWGTTSSDSVYASGAIYRLLPEPLALPADRVSYSSGIMRARVSYSSGITVQFEYGTDPKLSQPVLIYADFTPGGANGMIVSGALSNLSPSTTYYYRARVRRADGTVQFGEILSFTTGFAEPQAAVVVSKGAAVPGAGTPGSGIPSGAIWRTFGVPAWGDNSRLAFVANLQLPTGDPLMGIVAGTPAAPVVVAERGDTAPGLLLGTVFSSFKDPVINQAGEVAFISRVTGGLLPGKSRQGIWSNAGVSSGKPEWLVALQGIQAADAPFGAIWKTFKSVALSDSGVISFTATLEQGRGGVTAANDFGLWQATPSGTSLLLREGQTLEMDGVTRKVKSFVALFSTSSRVPVRVTFSDNTQALLGFNADAEPEVIAASGEVVSNGGFAIFRSFGMPAFSGTGAAALTATLVRGVDGSTNDRGIFLLLDGSWSMVARKGGVAPGGVIVNGWPAKFASFYDPLINAEGQVAFLGTTTGSVKGIWWSGGLGSNLQLVASTADTTVPGLYGVRFTAFRSLALPDGELSGPVFVAKVEGLGIDSSNDVGLWAVDSAGVLRLIVREGDTVDGKVLRSFTILSTVPGSSAQPGSYDANRQVLYRAFFTDGSQSLITVRIP